MILFNDFKREVTFLRKEIDLAISKVLDSGWFILGKELEAFENNFAAWNGNRYCIGVASGTEAIALSLMAHDIGPGDEVITTNLTAFPTITGIIQSGARPVVVDISASTGLIDPERIREKLTGKTKAIVPVHLYGQCCNMNEIHKIAGQENLVIIEDCAQSTGATFNGKKCGTIAHCGAFSFYPTKNLGAYGDGGAITTDNHEIYLRLTALRNYGQSRRYYHDSPGINSRLDEIQAAILNIKLRYVDHWNQERGKIARMYRQNLQTVGCLEEMDYGQPVYHLFVVKTPARDQLSEYLHKNEIQTLIHYPVPVHRQKAFQWQKKESFPESEKFAENILSLPVYPGLTENEIEKIINTINEFKA